MTDQEKPALLPKADEVWASLTGPTARKSAVAVVDQGILSATSFFTGLMLARFCSKEEFGAYALAFSVLLVANGLQTALITGPLTVLGSARQGEDWRSYATAMALAQLVLGASLALLTAGASVVLQAAGLVGRPVAAVLLAMSAALFFVQAQELCRRVLYARQRAVRVLLNDACCCALQIGGLVALWKLGGGSWGHAGSNAAAGYIGASSALLCMACASAAAAFLGFWGLRGTLLARGVRHTSHLRDSWCYGRWELLSFVGGTLCGQVHPWLIGAMLGTAALGDVESARLVLAPLQLLMLGLPAVLLPRAACVFANEGQRGLRRFLLRLVPIWLFAVGAYCGAVALAPGAFLSLFYEEKYSKSNLLLLLWAGTYFFLAFATLPGIVLAAMRRPDLGVKANLPLAALTVGLAACLIPVGGTTGALAARMVGSFLSLVAVVLLASRLLGRVSAGQIGPLPARTPRGC